ncbi:MAG: flagellar biosynthesis protein FlhA [Acidimicrobiia bacterium]|nr:MAG: flagellar biosynthesis protein FlhA [Acidimicrobiia bacterium]
MTSTRIGQIAIPAAIVGIVVMMVVPLPTPLIDLLLVSNIGLATLALLASMSTRRVLDFSIFPSYLLIATLFRLALNVSVTRLVLLDGYAGKVVEAFGHFVIGGSVIVGLVIFLILIVIQFIVITNGAGRVAEVAARFTLDAMPGKQMAIDADLNAGIIDEDVAKLRRKEIADEADFYGAMDGASKFVKGDAIAAIVIVLINLIGGFAVGVMQKGMSFTEAIETYSLLTVGDGLVAQIPALLISLSSGLIVTRAATESDLGTDLLHQFTRHRRTLQLAGAAICATAITPGLPKPPFLLVGGALLLIASRIPGEGEAEARAAEEAAAAAAAAAREPAPDSPEHIATEMRVEPLELELSYDLIDLVDPARGGDLLDRVRALRRKLALELGIVIPLVRTRDNLDLPAHTYAVRVHGVETGRGEAPPGHVLVLGDDLPNLPGMATREPVFGLPARWVPVEFRHQAEITGATVVDRASVVTTHLAEIVRRNAARLLSRQDVKMLLDMVKQSDPIVVDELNGANVTTGEIQRVLQLLLDEGIGIRDIVRILEVVGERSRVTKDTEQIAEAVRTALGPAISASYARDGRLPVLTLEPVIEHSLAESLRTSEHGSYLALEPGVAEALALAIAREAEAAEMKGVEPVFVCAAQLRPAMRRLLRAAAPRLPVLAYTELGSQLELETIGVVNLGQPAAV